MFTNHGVWSTNKGKLFEHLNEGYLGLQQSKPHPNALTRSNTMTKLVSGLTRYSHSHLVCWHSLSMSLDQIEPTLLQLKSNALAYSTELKMQEQIYTYLAINSSTRRNIIVTAANTYTNIVVAVKLNVLWPPTKFMLAFLQNHAKHNITM